MEITAIIANMRIWHLIRNHFVTVNLQCFGRRLTFLRILEVIFYSLKQIVIFTVGEVAFAKIFTVMMMCLKTSFLIKFNHQMHNKFGI